MMAVAIGAWLISLFLAGLVLSVVIDNAHEKVRLDLRIQIKAGEARNAKNQKEIEHWRTKYRLERGAPR